MKIDLHFKDEGAFVMKVDSGAHLHWQTALFLNDAEHFYGFAHIQSAFDGQLHFNGYTLVRYFAQRPWSMFTTVEWIGFNETLSHKGATWFTWIESGQFVPSYVAWRERKLRWIPHPALDVTFDFYEAHVFHEAVATCPHDHYVAPLYDAFVRIETALDEADFYAQLGVQDDVRTTDVVLRLDEPDDEGNWPLAISLRHRLTNEVLKKRLDARDVAILEAVAPELFNAERQLLSMLDEWTAWLFLTTYSEQLTTRGFIVEVPSWWKTVKQQKLTPTANVKTGKSLLGLNAMLDFNWRFSTQNIDISEAEFMALVRDKRRLVNIGGEWIALNPEMIQSIATLLKDARKKGFTLQDIIQQRLLERQTTVGEQEVVFELDAPLESLVKSLKEATFAERTKPDHLRPYQVVGTNWLLSLRDYRLGACLADDMGLGKTVQMIAYFQHIVDTTERSTPFLIICPTSVVGNWQKELARFAPALRVYVHYGSARVRGEQLHALLSDYDVVITSYGLATQDYDTLEPIEWEAIAIDEAQNIKNAHTKQSRAIRKLRGKHKIALTGTPVENRLTELWSIFDFINHGLLGSLTSFQREYATPIEREQDEAALKQLHTLIQPFLLRRTKRDEHVALNLPDKVEQKEYLPLTLEQASLYEQVVQEAMATIERSTGMERRGLVLQMLSRLKQICNHPALFTSEKVTKVNAIVSRSEKMEKLVELAQNIAENDESCLIFTQYIDMGEMIVATLAHHFGRDSVFFLNGSTRKEMRDAMVDAFQRGEKRFFVLSLRAGGTGLNLTAANHVIHYDRWWNPAVENQATDRAYRIGQTRFVHVHKLIATGTLEEKIDAMIEQKQQLSADVIVTDQWMTELSNEQLRDLV